MTPFESALNNLAKYVKKAREANKDDGDTLVKCLMEISCTMHYLADERAKFHDEFQNIINQRVLAGESVSRAENKAHVEVPQLYKLRQLMETGQNTIDAIRTNISWIKQGLNNG